MIKHIMLNIVNPLTFYGNSINVNKSTHSLFEVCGEDLQNILNLVEICVTRKHNTITTFLKR